jgi:transcriptional regulator with XRE-family HTH domain
MSNASGVIAEYLRQTGWSQQKLAKLAGVDRAVINRAVATHGDRAGRIGELAAMRIERATVAAFTRGETAVPPLRALDLYPITKGANDSERPTGT